MGPRYFSENQPFEFPSDFGFSGSAKGRHDAHNHPDTPDDYEYGDGSFLEKKAKGGRARGPKTSVTVITPTAGGPPGAPQQPPGIPAPKVASALNGAAILGAKVGARVGAKAAAPGAPPGALGGMPTAPMAAPAASPMGMRRGGRVDDSGPAMDEDDGAPLTAQEKAMARRQAASATTPPVRAIVAGAIAAS